MGESSLGPVSPQGSSLESHEATPGSPDRGPGLRGSTPRHTLSAAGNVARLPREARSMAPGQAGAGWTSGAVQ